MANTIKAKRIDTEVTYMVYNRETKQNENYSLIFEGKISDSKAMTEAKKDVKDMNAGRDKKNLLVLIDVIQKREMVSVYVMAKSDFFLNAQRVDD